jgi:hypothetical protein
MTAIIAGTAPALVGIITIITNPQRNTNLQSLEQKQKGGAWRLPLLLLYCVVSEAR